MEHNLSRPIYEAGDPRVVRLSKACLWYIVLPLGWLLVQVKQAWPRTQRFIDQVPNAMSVLRIPASPVVIWELSRAVIDNRTSTAWWWFGGLIGLVLLDGLDGPLARQLDATSKFGKVIDPAADKVLAACLALSYGYLVWRFQGVAVFGFVAFFIGWVIHVEIKIVQVAADTGKVLRVLPEADIPGANVNGKIKFTLEAVGFIAAFAMMIADPTNKFGGYFLAATMMVARLYADRSLGRHRAELTSFKQQASAQGIIFGDFGEDAA